VTARRPRRIPRSFWTRAVYSVASIAFVVAIGMWGMHTLEGISYLDAFYFTALLATGEGPSYTPITAGGKLFAGILSFVSVGVVITALLFLFGPFFGSVIKLGLEKVEEEAEKEKEKIEKRD
jgi:Na+/H+ antiporter NhaC